MAVTQTDETAPGAGAGEAATAPEESATLSADLAGLDTLDRADDGLPSRRRALWASLWPKLAAIGLGLAIWQGVVWTEVKPRYVLPGPAAVLGELRDMVADGTLAEATVNTMVRAVSGFALALVIGVVVGGLLARMPVLRAAFGSLITGVQTMPSIAWFPLAILLFQLTEKAILFVVVLGAAPAIANGLIAGADQIPPILLRAGRVLGARGFAAWRHVVLPASLPSFVGGLKQGWAFAWRSLMAGELLVVIAEKPSIGSVLQVRRNLADAEGLIATMIVILVIGIAIDTLVFGRLERAVLRRWGLAADRR
ncbi:MAG: ABC transporter permease [Acidimicrobiia bacterium]|nr:ABC transporter permease [Acidimicrobiia bacterium]